MTTISFDTVRQALATERERAVGVLVLLQSAGRPDLFERYCRSGQTVESIARELAAVQSTTQPAAQGTPRRAGFDLEWIETQPAAPRPAPVPERLPPWSDPAARGLATKRAVTEPFDAAAIGRALARAS